LNELRYRKGRFFSFQPTLSQFLDDQTQILFLLVEDEIVWVLRFDVEFIESLGRKMALIKM